jgi:hypothetical protein
MRFLGNYKSNLLGEWSVFVVTYWSGSLEIVVAWSQASPDICLFISLCMNVTIRADAIEVSVTRALLCI